jgi:hypothetical protein
MLRTTTSTILAITLLPTLAAATEGNFLTCTVGAKQLSLSIQDETVTYRYGPRGNPELVLQEPVATVDYQPWNGIGRGMKTAVQFNNYSYTYAVVTSPSDKQTNNNTIWYNAWISIRLDNDFTFLECKEEFSGDPLDAIHDAKTAINQCWSQAQEKWLEDCAD